jgi:hypothetical protein
MATPADDAPVVDAEPAAPRPAVVPELAPDTSSAFSSSVWDYAPATTEAAPAVDDSEGSTESWSGSNAALTVVRGLKGKAIRVTREGSGETFAFYAAKRLVSEKAGQPYRARAYVRTTSPGMYICLRVEERGGGVPTTTERCAAAKPGWRRVALKGKTADKGRRLVVSLHVMAALGGTSFDVDGFRLG